MKKNYKYKVIKLFNCQDMSEDVRKGFFDFVGNSEIFPITMNDSFVEWSINDIYSGLTSIQIRQVKDIDNWLIENGAKGDGFKGEFNSDLNENEEIGETVMISHWW